MSNMDYDQLDEIQRTLGWSDSDFDSRIKTYFEKFRARVAELEAENERLECLCDNQYAAGVKAGWNYCVVDDHVAMQKCIEDRQRGALPRLKALRMGLDSEAE